MAVIFCSALSLDQFWQFLSFKEYESSKRCKSTNRILYLFNVNRICSNVSSSILKICPIFSHFLHHLARDVLILFSFSKKQFLFSSINFSDHFPTFNFTDVSSLLFHSCFYFQFNSSSIWKLLQYSTISFLSCSIIVIHITSLCKFIIVMPFKR